ncbi:hypothetical protein KKF84_05960 [Myxococcota bacterium]|nr:hypothetical protein [Myxococcota bacterium]MBU1534844.1 hypothetical protein [Myxococcota bacterium]
MNRFVALVSLVLFSCNPRITDDGQGDGMVGQKPGTYERFVQGKTTAPARGIKKTSVQKVSAGIPQENLVESPNPPLPDLETEDLARLFIGGISSGDAQKAMAFAIPVKLMIRIRDMHMTDLGKAREAARSLARKTRGRIEKKIKKIIKKSKMKEATFESIALGTCRFVAKGDDWNRYAFWRCTGSTLYFHVEGERRFLKLAEMINWGAKWYIVKL